MTDRLNRSALEASERRFRAIAEQAFELLMIVDPNHAVRWANHAFERVLGYPAEFLIGRDIIPLIHPDDLAALHATTERLAAAPGTTSFLDLRMQTANGEWRSLESSATNLIDDPAIGGFVVSLRDITDRQRVVGALLASEQRYRSLFERAQDAIYTADRAGWLTAVNPAAERITGYTRDELLGMSVFDLIAPEERERAREILASAASGHDVTIEVQLTAKDGQRRFVETSGRIVNPELGDAQIEGIARDTTDRHRLEDELRHEATHDGLTSLPNRTLFLDRLDQALARAARNRAEVAVMLLDIDDFKLINDSLGHAAGDQVLIEVTRRLRSMMRTGETVARLGGDEFGLLAEGFQTRRGVVAIAERITSAFAEPFAIGGTDRQLSGSLGIVVATPDEDPSDLLRDADTAMYRVKSVNKGGFAFFDAASRAQLLRQLALSKDLEIALREHSLEVHYQPVVSVADGEILAVEALSRWSHPDWGRLHPAEFIPIAEETGAIVALGAYVLDEAARQLAEWRAEQPGALPLGVFVNVSPQELSARSFAQSALQTLARHGLSTADVAFELTERVFIEDDNVSVGQTLTELQENGVRVLLDDFGTGYSSLASLQRFPLAALKIDRYFIAAIDGPNADAPIIRAIIGLGGALGMTVVAEGVETPTQLEYLRRVGCDTAQGYLLGAPKPASAFTALLGPSALPGRARGAAEPAAPHPASHDAPIPSNDDARLGDLHSYDVLDTEPEPALDDLARLAAEICETPLAFISLVDHEREFFKAAFGSEQREEPRNSSFCGHAVAAEDVLVVRDTLEDPRFAENPQVVGVDGIRFYAGVPLTTADGFTLGTLCVKDTRPRDLSERQLEALAALGRQVVAQLELRRLLLPARRRETLAPRSRRGHMQRRAV